MQSVQPVTASLQTRGQRFEWPQELGARFFGKNDRENRARGPRPAGTIKVADVAPTPDHSGHLRVARNTRRLDRLDDPVLDLFRIQDEVELLAWMRART